NADSAAQHPFPNPRFGLEPIFAVELGCSPSDVSIKRILGPLNILWMDAAEPLFRGRCDLMLGESEHLLPASGINNRVADKIPVPHAICCAADRRPVSGVIEDQPCQTPALIMLRLVRIPVGIFIVAGQNEIVLNKTHSLPSS